MMFFAWTLCITLLALYIAPCPGAPGDAYGMINDVQTECEFQALTLGGRLADAFNSYDESVGLLGRTHHQFFHRSPFFSRMVHYEVDRHYALTANVPQARQKYAHPHYKTLRNANSTAAFGALSNRWIYFIGDGTLFPLVNTLLSPFFASRGYRGAEKWKREHCKNTQDGANYTTSHFPERNVYYCESHGYGEKGKLSFEWDDFLLEDFSAQRLASRRLFSLSETDRKPDVIVLQVGFLGCFLAYNRGNGSHPDGAIEARTESNSEPFFQAFSALAKEKLVGTSSHALTTFVSLASRNRLRDYYCDVCTWKLNRKISHDAHSKTFIVLEREEIEHRLFMKSEEAETAIIRSTDLSSFPAPQIVTASLVSALSCLDKNITFQISDSKDNKLVQGLLEHYN